MRLHASNPNLSTIDFVEEKNYSDGSETSSEFTKMQEDLFHIAHKGKWNCLLYVAVYYHDLNNDVTSENV